MQDQLVCHGCRNRLMYPRGATHVRCALCNNINIPPQGIDLILSEKEKKGESFKE